MQAIRVPFILRLAGLWLLWSAWCSCAGWLLSAVSQLHGWGHTALLPVLVVASWQWLRATAPPPISTSTNKFFKLRKRLFRPLPLIYVSIATLSLVSGLLHVPWSFDAVTYRLPRLLEWWAAHQWHWIGTLDHRLDFSSCGFEWQMLPVIELTQSDRLLFLLNWIPFLLMPGLTFYAFRSLGVRGKSARRWMWMLPTGYCFALQSSGIQNDGYSVNYTLAAVAFSTFALHSQRICGLAFAVIAAALLTGAKVSNLPLLLPLGVLCFPLLKQVRWLNWRTILVAIVAITCSFMPLALLSGKQTGDWTGNPADQWSVKVHGSAGAVTANLILLANDAAQLPYFPGSKHVNSLLGNFNQSPFIFQLQQAHRQFTGTHFGELAYEGSAGLGFGLAAYITVLLVGAFFVRPKAFHATPLPWAWQIAPWLAWIAYAVYLSKLGSYHTPRIAAPYYPLLILAVLRLPRVFAMEQKRVSNILAGVAAFTVLPVVILTPVRPLVPIASIASITGSPAIDRIAGKYRHWKYLCDDLATLRENLPQDEAMLGYAGGFRDTPYGLWKPLGSRTIVELGLPTGPHAKWPPQGMNHAVVTARGLKERYQMELGPWLTTVRGEVVFEYSRNLMLDASSPPQYESWFLVKLNSK